MQPKYGSCSQGHRETEMGTTDLGSVQLSKTRESSQPSLTETHNKNITVKQESQHDILLSFTLGSHTRIFADTQTNIHECLYVFPLHMYTCAHIKRHACTEAHMMICSIFEFICCHVQRSDST